MIHNSHIKELVNITKQIKTKFPQSEVFLVGGAVRDLIMGREVGDMDVIVRGVQIQRLITFLKTQGKANLVGKNFGVIKFTPKGSDKSLDIALPRTDHAFNTGGYRDVKVAYDHTLPIEKDLERRDFTCNAIALQVNDKLPITNYQSKLKSKIKKTIHYPLFTNHSSLIDPFNGLADIQKHIIRAVGNPDKRFKEDYTRMLRALRFSCQLGFEIEKKTWGSVKKNVTKINAQTRNHKNTKSQEEYLIARELVAKEFLKGMYHNPIKMLELMDKSGLLRELIPELLPMKTCKQDAKWHSEGNVWTHTMLALRLAHAFCNPKSPYLSSRALTRDPETKTNKNRLSSRGGFATWRSRSNAQNEIASPSLAITQSFGFSFSLLDSSPKSGMTTQEILELYLGILFHDLGKPQTAGHEKNGDKKAITYYGHETVGAEMTRSICERLKLSAPEEFGINVDHIVWLVKNHMLLHPEVVDNMRNNTIEKYFFNQLVPGNTLLGVCFFDGLASVPKGRSLPLKVRGNKGVMNQNSHNSPNLPYLKGGTNTNALKSWPSLQGWWKAIARIKQLSKGRRDLPKPLLNGNEIMKLLNIKPGPEVGKAIEQLREAQLSRKVTNTTEAKTFIKTL